ncbi:bifunctional 5,10-methylenetetrahydrofolate dehydrogenase/5,10-methenyltetrahydrofolate cyclohydrolase [Nocardia wallacei]|uniref:bifunctional 5,10-methylenetetrahydrofolate dehydrogenase/5,10-methenyltetrahydrofolate cyclohydrolase n=1 Tax=Nocardia wallacei TaxID=480035 RepID=UPI0024538AB5|nr:bifunctional 5,10-methylenetetrahydrofolate dehydrogenase/5,10-methenyltetrahydrofolate cyclohydrolase [Nocardia wallacei]
MDTTSLTGKELAAALNAETEQRAAALTERGSAPRLVLVVANDDPASGWYVKSLQRAADRLGIACDTVDLGADATAEAIRAELTKLSGDPAVDAVMLQTPLPAGVALDDVSSAIAAGKDVDGVSPLSLGLLAAGLPTFPPATAEAVVELAAHHGIPLAGRHVAVVGRSNVVGKPLAQLLLAENATVTVCHSRTVDLPAVTAAADIVVAARGRAGRGGAPNPTRPPGGPTAGPRGRPPPPPGAENYRRAQTSSDAAVSRAPKASHSEPSDTRCKVYRCLP